MPRAITIVLALITMVRTGSSGPTHVVTIMSASDASGQVDPEVRKHHVATMRRVLEPAVAAIDAEARRLAVDARQLDVSIVRFDLRTDGSKYYMSTQLRAVISDAHGRMLTMLSSSATVEVPASRYRANRVSELRDQAVADASSGLADSVRAHVLRAG